MPLTLIAAAAQVVRNGAQANLTAKIGTLGATQVRFVFGLPFAFLFLAVALLTQSADLPQFGSKAVGWTLIGGVSQIGGTALMLIVMHRRAFGVAYAYIKTEPVLVALLGVILLAENLPLIGWIAVAAVTAGVVIASVKPGEYGGLLAETRMIAAGVMAGGLFGLAAIAFRGATIALSSGDFVLRSLTVMAAAMTIQTVLLGSWLALRDRAAFTGSLREWRGSLGAGFAGAVSSAFWFAAFALTAAANVRTFGLIELPMVALVSGRLSGKAMARHELAGMGIIMTGVVLLLAGHAA